MTSETPKTPMIFKIVLMRTLLSMKARVVLLDGFKSEVKVLSILMVISSLGSLLTMFAYQRIMVNTCFRFGRFQSAYIS